MAIKDAFTQLNEATKSALDDIRVASGKSTDRDIIRYESFKSEDFDQMRQEYGDDAVLDYIKNMETKRMMPVR